MKILICNKFHFILGGTERYLFDLSDRLREMGHTVINFSTRDKRNVPSDYSEYFIESFNFSRGPEFRGSPNFKNAFNFIYSLPARINIERAIERYTPDIAHIHNIYHHISSSIIHSLKKQNVPMVMTVHDYKLICPNYTLFTNNQLCERCKSGKFYNAVRFKCVKNSRLASLLACLEMYFCKMLKIYEKNIDMFIAPSEFVRDKLVDFGVDRQRIIYLPYAIDLSVFKPNFEPGGYILYFGSISRRKGTPLLLKVAKQFKHIPVKLIGEGPYKEALEQLIQDNDLKNVELLGYMPLNELKGFISNALLVVVPSLWYEVAGLAIYEAFASGKCVVASNIGGIPEIVKDGINGMLFNPGDENELFAKIKYLLDNPLRVRELGKNAFEAIHKHNNFDNHCKTLADTYSNIMFGKPVKNENFIPHSAN